MRCREKAAMITLLRRSFTVDRPLQDAWCHLARVEHWTSWAKHIKRVKVEPPGELGPKSTGFIQLNNGVRSAFTMTEFNPYSNWKWVGRFLWLKVCYDHCFEKLSPTQTKLRWVVEANGIGASVFGRLFAKIYRKNLDHAIPLLVKEMNSKSVFES
jgi:Polyketide cyclase / dehydrase and lipid transport